MAMTRSERERFYCEPAPEGFTKDREGWISLPCTSDAVECIFRNASAAPCWSLEPNRDAGGEYTEAMMPVFCWLSHYEPATNVHNENDRYPDLDSIAVLMGLGECTHGNLDGLMRWVFKSPWRIGKLSTRFPDWEVAEYKFRLNALRTGASALCSFPSTHGKK